MHEYVLKVQPEAKNTVPIPLVVVAANDTLNAGIIGGYTFVNAAVNWENLFPIPLVIKNKVDYSFLLEREIIPRTLRNLSVDPIAKMMNAVIATKVNQTKDLKKFFAMDFIDTKDKDLYLSDYVRIKNKLLYDNYGINCGFVIKNSGLTIADECAHELTEAQKLMLAEHFKSGISGANAFLIKNSASILSVNRGVFKTFTEEESIAFLAHELGHYYHADGFRKLNYYYEIPETNSIFEPVISNKKEIIDLIAEFNKEKITETKIIPKLEGMKLNPYVFYSTIFANSYIPDNEFEKNVYTYLKERCTTDKCSIECKDTYKLLDSGLYKTLVKDVSQYVNDYIPINREMLIDYLNYENKFVLCAKKMPPKIPELDYIYESLLEEKIISGEEQSFWDVLLKSSNYTNKREENIDKLVRRAKELRVGWYTSEQQADEFMIELAVNNGISTEAIISAFLKLLELDTQKELSLSYKISVKDCKKLLDNDWMENGKVAYIPEGSFYVDTHHSTCFRIYNIWREIRAHKYKTNPEKPKISTTWKDALNSL